MEKVERVQYQAALAITGAWQGSSRSKIYDELGWETLSDRRKYRRVLQIHKMINNNTLSYLNKKLPPNCREMFNGSMCTTFHAIRCKSYRYMNNFFPAAIASWNLFMEIFNYKFVPSLRLLKNDIISLIRPESKSFFKIHDPTGLRYIFQLRVRLSPLNVINNVTNSLIPLLVPFNATKALKIQYMFYFLALFYTVQRVTLVTSN